MSVLNKLTSMHPDSKRLKLTPIPNLPFCDLAGATPVDGGALCATGSLKSILSNAISPKKVISDSNSPRDWSVGKYPGGWFWRSPGWVGII